MVAPYSSTPLDGPHLDRELSRAPVPGQGYKEARCAPRAYLKPSGVQELGMQAKPTFTGSWKSDTEETKYWEQTKRARGQLHKENAVESWYGAKPRSDREQREQVGKKWGGFWNAPRKSERLRSSHLLMNALDRCSWTLNNHYGALNVDEGCCTCNTCFIPLLVAPFYRWGRQPNSRACGDPSFVMQAHVCAGLV